MSTCKKPILIQDKNRKNTVDFILHMYQILEVFYATNPVCIFGIFLMVFGDGSFQCWNYYLDILLFNS